MQQYRNILSEPDNCTKIPSLQNEYYKYVNLIQKPVQIYLDHCRAYAEQNLDKENSLNIKDYKFGRKDFANHVLSSKIIEAYGLNDDDYGPAPIGNKELSGLLTTTNIKVYTDIVFVNGFQHLVVKTWQKISVDNNFQKGRKNKWVDTTRKIQEQLNIPGQY